MIVPTFTYRGETLELLDHPYNTTIRNERAVEIPIVRQWLSNQVGQGLELGNVLTHYVDEINHRRVDKYEEADGVENIDVLDIEGSYPWVLCISTLEHIGWDWPETRELNGAVRALNHLRGLLSPGGQMLVTVPFGSHPGLDLHLLQNHHQASRWTVLARKAGEWVENTQTGRYEYADPITGWEEIPADLNAWRRYGNATQWADAVWVGEWNR